VHAGTAARCPPGQAKKQSGNVPPGHAKQQTGNVPPGQAKKDKDAAPQAEHGNSANEPGHNKEK
jgi:hypothetical protein